MSCSGSPRFRPRPPSTRPSRSPRSSGPPSRADSSTACWTGSCACVELVAEHAQVTVGGNHEYAVTGRLDLTWFNRYARAAAEWTQERLDDDHRAWLGALPLVSEVADATLVHASPAQPEEWDYLLTAE